MKTRKGDLTYTDGVMKIIIKRKYAYYYNLKTGSLVSKAEIDDHLFTRIKNAGFKRESFELRLAKTMGYKEPQKIDISDLKVSDLNSYTDLDSEK